mmetsp:Transcript_13311/g.18183  ORF Transcript_13311/g.18183 Transcript_13311/m.18183 type:complete len:295 (+) Transcript_13311:324-1208(+)|eukprot:CAMPEP_0196590664 /NCGR_PEP_ID=MMETSP1081-20130531/67186_1 /TAXON_ID=36882 /ORGANISM="Pyramimonas amylifera, Strain CCMP720" /LENGTH=294 /DNA_ID=CAMNT_0041913819 /DNA_START=248 /DNA_END=1132 /DNA_ORIENTATION=+
MLDLAALETMTKTEVDQLKRVDSFMSSSDVESNASSVSCKDSHVHVQPEDSIVGTMPYSLWPAIDEEQENKWGFCQLHGDSFKVRGANYLSNKKKQLAAASLMRLVTMDWFKSESQTDHVCGRKGGTCQKLLQRDDIDFVLAVSIQFPAASHFSMIAYFTPSVPITEGSLLDRFIKGDSEFKKQRLKLIPRVAEGAWVVQRSVGSTPVLLGKAVEVSHYSGPGYYEMNVNTGSSAVAHRALKCVFGYAASIVMDFAWIIEGRAEEELPERLLGNFRVAYLNEDQAVAPPPEEYI